MRLRDFPRKFVVLHVCGECAIDLHDPKPLNLDTDIVKVIRQNAYLKIATLCEGFLIFP